MGSEVILFTKERNRFVWSAIVTEGDAQRGWVARVPCSSHKEEDGIAIFATENVIRIGKF